MHGQLSDGDSTATKFIQGLSKAAEHKNVKLTIKDATQSQSMNKRFIQYEHQIFNDKAIPAITLTAKGEKHFHRYQKFSLFDNDLNNEELRRNILILSEALVHLVYTFHEPTITYFIDNQALVSDQYINQIK